MKIHELKIKLQYWEEIMHESKTFELRKNDRGFEVGDLIHFTILGQTILGAPNSVSDRNIFKITYILENVPEYGLMDGYCILGIKMVNLNV